MPIDDRTRDAYGRLAAEYPEWSDHPARTYLEWPATRSLLPDVSGLRVLDAGCGTGTYTEWLTDQGATVVGVDATAEAVERARERLPEDAADVVHADLTQPLDFLDDASVDLVLILSDKTS